MGRPHTKDCSGDTGSWDKGEAGVREDWHEMELDETIHTGILNNLHQQVGCQQTQCETSWMWSVRNQCCGQTQEAMNNITLIPSKRDWHNESEQLNKRHYRGSDTSSMRDIGPLSFQCWFYLSWDWGGANGFDVDTSFPKIITPF